MNDIFISYERSDKQRVKIIAKAFENQGFSVWWDPKIPPGKTFDDAIADALQSTKCVIVLWSKSSVKSDWVREEAMMGAQRGILFPVLIDDVEIPIGFKRIQTVRIMDLVGLPAKEEFKQLLTAISNTLGYPVSPNKKSEQKRQNLEKKYTLRNVSRNDLSFLEVSSMIKKYDFYCALEYAGCRESTIVPDYMKKYCNDTGRGIVNAFEPRKFDLVIYDYATGLYWQREASETRMIPLQSSLYLEQINSQKYGGYNDWRLPTLEEAMSLVKPSFAKKDNNHQDPIFSLCYSIWTSDKYENKTWYVCFDDGNCRLNISLNKERRCYVRAVRSSIPEQFDINNLFPWQALIHYPPALGLFSPIKIIKPKNRGRK